MHDSQRHIDGLTLMFSSLYARWLVLKRQYSREKLLKNTFTCSWRCCRLPSVCYQRLPEYSSPVGPKRRKRRLPIGDQTFSLKRLLLTRKMKAVALHLLLLFVFFVVIFTLCVFWRNQWFLRQITDYPPTIQTYSLDFAQLSWWYLSCHVCHCNWPVTMTTGQNSILRGRLCDVVESSGTASKWPFS